MSDKVRVLGLDFEAAISTEADGGASIVENDFVGPGDFAGLGGIGYARMSKGFQVESGAHPVWALFVILKGKLLLETPTRPAQTFVAGDSFFLEPGCPHTETSLEEGTVVLTALGDHEDPDAANNYVIRTVDLESSSLPDLG